jgi:hypothetical protein
LERICFCLWLVGLKFAASIKINLMQHRILLSKQLLITVKSRAYKKPVWPKVIGISIDALPDNKPVKSRHAVDREGNIITQTPKTLFAV